MRLSNKNKIPVYNFFNTLLLMLFSAGIIGFIFNELKFDILGNISYVLIAAPMLLLVIFHLVGRQIFEYDSDGEALNFKNRNIIPCIHKELSDEFPKYKLIRFEIVAIFFIKRLYVTVSSKNNGATLLKYEISYLTRKEISDLKVSLNKVVKANQEKRHQE